jgi:hypothetical protein
MAQYRPRERGQIVRFALNGGLLVVTFALFGCSSPSIPSWATAPNNHYVRIAERSYQKRMYVAPIRVRLKGTYERPHFGSAPSKFEDVDPSSEEWQYDQEIKQREFDSLLDICRGC